MRHTVALLALALSIAIEGRAADGWVPSTPAAAQRLVTVEALAGGRTASVWRFFLKKVPGGTNDRDPEHRVFRMRDPRGGRRTVAIHSDTWLGGTSDVDIVASTEWYPDAREDGTTRIMKDIFLVPFGGTETFDTGNLTSLRVSYRRAPGTSR